MQNIHSISQFLNRCCHFFIPFYPMGLCLFLPKADFIIKIDMQLSVKNGVTCDGLNCLILSSCDILMNSSSSYYYLVESHGPWTESKTNSAMFLWNCILLLGHSLKSKVQSTLRKWIFKHNCKCMFSASKVIPDLEQLKDSI